jgi:hypothetical protein
VTNGNYTTGTTLPVAFQLTDANGKFVPTAVAHILVDGQPGVSSSWSDDGNLFSYDRHSNQYIFNLSTEGLSVGQHTITVTLDDGTSYLISMNLAN